jgi:membrane protein YdbS with pleckstrin-like domain
MVVIDLQTKQCPFCAETIQAQAIKCRFCDEFLNSGRARALEASSELNTQPSEAEETNDNVLVVAGLLIKLPLEHLLGLKLTESQALAFGQYRVIAGVALAVLVMLFLVIKMVRLKMIYYEVTADRIEWSRGIFDRRVDNLDMFRVIDLKLRRSLFDCIVGVGTVGLITTDKTDPEFVFEKIRDSRRLYDIIKKASLEADKQSGVIHVE